MVRSLTLLFVLSLCLVAPPLGHAVDGAGGAGPLRVLLVGNSYTKFNLLPTLLARFAREVPDGPPMRVDAVARGGYTLRRHWLKSEARKRIRFGHYTHVVLQDHSMRAIDNADEMDEYVGRFVDLINQSGARPILYETWARRSDAILYRQRPELDSPTAMQERVGDAYRRLAADTGARLAPVGSTFMRALDHQLGLPLYRADGSHPSIQGSYLAACVIYGAITGRDPGQSQYTPWGMSEGDAERLRQLSGEEADAPLPAEEMAAAPLTPAQ